MSKPSAVALCLLPLVVAACPTETKRRPPSHELPTRKTPANADKANEAQGGVASLVKETAEQAKAADAKAADAKAADAKAPARPPAAGDIPAPPDVAAPPANATKTDSGLAYRVLTKGTGDAHPSATDRVSVHYSGWTTDGKMFDSSVTRGKPTSFPLKRVIKGWTEGLQLMVVGEKTRFWIPVELAYENKPGKPAGMLVFDVELLEIVK